MPKVVAMLRIVARPPERSQIQAMLLERSEVARARPGCLTSEVYCDSSEERALLYLEIWRDERAARDHVLAPDYRLLLDLMEASDEAPRLEFFFASETRDLSWVAELRGAS